MIKIYNRRARKLMRVELDPGEQQFLASYNLRQIAPEAWAQVKRNGAKRWLKRKLSGDIGLPLKNDSTKGR